MLEIREVEDLQIPDVKAFEHLIKSKITKPDYLFYQLFACFYLHRKKKEAEAENDFLEQLLILILLFEIELALFSNKEMIEQNLVLRCHKILQLMLKINQEHSPLIIDEQKVNLIEKAFVKSDFGTWLLANENQKLKTYLLLCKNYVASLKDQLSTENHFETITNLDLIEQLNVWLEKPTNDYLINHQAKILEAYHDCLLAIIVPQIMRNYKKVTIIIDAFLNHLFNALISQNEDVSEEIEQAKSTLILNFKKHWFQFVFRAETYILWSWGSKGPNIWRIRKIETASNSLQDLIVIKVVEKPDPSDRDSGFYQIRINWTSDNGYNYVSLFEQNQVDRKNDLLVLNPKKKQRRKTS